MKLPKRIRDKVIEKKDFVKAELGDSFYDWVIDPETEILRPDDYRKIIDTLYKAPE